MEISNCLTKVSAKAIGLIGILCFVLVLVQTDIRAQSQENLQVRYFKHLVWDETVFNDFRGANEILQNQTKVYKHYKFKYDHLGRVLSISYEMNDRLIDLSNNMDNIFFICPLIKFRYSANKVTVEFYDKNGNRMNFGNAYEAQIAYTRHGEKEGLKYFDSNGKVAENWYGIASYEWVKNGETIFEKRYNAKGEPFIRHTIFGNGFTRKRVGFKYDSVGYLQEILHVDESGNLTENTIGTSIEKYYFNRDGNYLGWEMFDQNGLPSNGSWFDVHKESHILDGSGNIIKYDYFDKTGIKTNMSQGISQSILDYGIDGSLLAEYFLDQMGDKSTNNSLGAHKITFEYHKDGQIKSMSYWDVNGNLVINNWNGAARIIFEYNDQNVQIGQIRYDQDMNRMN